MNIEKAIDLRFCNTDDDFSEKIIESIATSLFKGKAVRDVKCRYREMVTNFPLPVNEWSTSENAEYDQYQDLKIPIADLKDSFLVGKSFIGIDLPVWFNYSASNTRVMIVGMEPMRKKDEPGFAVLASPFALSRYMDPKSRKIMHRMFTFVQELVSANYSSYVTDIGKSYSLGNGKYTGDTSINDAVFKEELNLFHPDYIMTLGVSAYKGVLKSLDRLQLKDPYSDRLIPMTHPGYYWGRGNKNYFQELCHRAAASVSA